MDSEDLAAVTQVVIDEVHRTTPVRLAFAFAPWFDDGADEDSGPVRPGSARFRPGLVRSRLTRRSTRPDKHQ